MIEFLCKRSWILKDWNGLERVRKSFLDLGDFDDDF